MNEYRISVPPIECPSRYGVLRRVKVEATFALSWIFASHDVRHTPPPWYWRIRMVAAVLWFFGRRPRVRRAPYVALLTFNSEHLAQLQLKDGGMHHFEDPVALRAGQMLSVVVKNDDLHEPCTVALTLGGHRLD